MFCLYEFLFFTAAFVDWNWPQRLLFACGVNSYTFSHGSSIVLFIPLSQTVSTFLSLFLFLSSPFRLTWIAWFSQTLVWLVRPHPLYPSSCQSCAVGLCVVVVLCVVKPKYLSRYFPSHSTQLLWYSDLFPFLLCCKFIPTGKKENTL